MQARWRLMQRLILFDIDGTLLTTNGVAGRAFRSALQRVFGTSGPRDGYSFAGKTDPQIAGDLMRLAGVSQDRVDAALADVLTHYAVLLEESMSGDDVHVFPGVRELLERLDTIPDTVLGLLTGNAREGARLKLGAAGLPFERFQVGAFGSDHRDRRELPAIAIARTEELFGHRFSGKSVVIIGDTPLDVACGEHLGVRTIAVATGSYSEEELRLCSPDYLFASLVDVDAVCRAIFE